MVTSLSPTALSLATTSLVTMSFLECSDEAETRAKRSGGDRFLKRVSTKRARLLRQHLLTFDSTSNWNTYRHALDQDHIRLITLSLVEGSDEAETWG